MDVPDYFIIPDDIWGDDDFANQDSGNLTEGTFQHSRAALEEYFVDEMIVFGPLNLRNMYDLSIVNAHAGSSIDIHCDDVALFHQNSTNVATTTEEWRAFFDKELYAAFDEQLISSACESAANAPARVGNESLAYVLPVFTRRMKPVLLDAEKGDDRVRVQSFSIKATEWQSDIVHDFNASETTSKALNDANAMGKEDEFDEVASMGSSQRSSESARLGSDEPENQQGIVLTHESDTVYAPQDNTAFTLSGAVLFPSSMTAGSTRCGLFGATVKATLVSTDSQTDVPSTQTDESGWFEFSLTQGKTYSITVSYEAQEGPDGVALKSHTICYTGDTIASATTVEPDESCDDATSIEMDANKYIFFADITKTFIELGAYHGECETKYIDTVFKITPINGCHKSQYVTAEKIANWRSEWPYAPLDYSIMLESGPSISLDPGDDFRLENEWFADGCNTEPGDMVQYFRSRDSLQRLALMSTIYTEERYPIKVQYRYHGYLCVSIDEAADHKTIPRIDDDSSICYYENDEIRNGLLKQHLLGKSVKLNSLDEDKTVNVRVFELHAQRGSFAYCNKLPGVNTNEEGLSTKIEFREDVTEETANVCHPNRGGHPTCDFEISQNMVSCDSSARDGDVQCVGFPAVASTPVGVTNYEADKIITGSASSINLVGNHRRSIVVTVHRFDGGRTVTASMKRELVPLGSKERGGNGDSDNTFWATVPIEGLVYTVVHDPPGGNSYAEVTAGTEVSMKYETSHQRARHKSDQSSANAVASLHWGQTTQKCLEPPDPVSPETCTDTAPVMDTGLEFDIETGETGPDVSMTMSVNDGWDMVMTLERNIRTSTDPGIPGRDGDVILGGGLELKYTLNDVLDVAGNHSKGCLKTHTEIRWSPSKPTSYVFGVHFIEKSVLPNLRYLLSQVLSDENTQWSETLREKINVWTRTLQWSSPTNAEEYRNASGLFDVESLVAKNAEIGQDDMLVAYETPREEGVQTLDEAGHELTDLVDTWEKSSSGSNRVQSWTMATFGRAMRVAYQNLDRESYFGSEDENGEWSMPDFLDKLQNDDDGAFSGMGMNSIAEDSYDSYVNDNTKTFDKDANGTRVDASFNGGQGRILSEVSDSGVVSVNSSTSDIFLTFSGGGASTEYTFTSKENVDGQDFSWTIEAIRTKNTDYFTNLFHTYFSTRFGVGFSGSKSLTAERVFGWSKYENVRTLYSLGDPDHGDKFVVQVKTDTRFGTPVFFVKGGRSQCPGERSTMFREGGVSLSVDAVRRTSLNPDEYAMYKLKITNESPYRERVNMGIVLYDSVTESIQTVISQAFKAAEIAAGEIDDNTAAEAVFQKVKETAELTMASQSDEVQNMISVALSAKVSAEANNITDADRGWYVAHKIANATQLARTAGSSMSGMTFKVNGREILPFGEPLPFHAIAGETLQSQAAVQNTEFMLAVSRASQSYTAEYIGVRLVSLCEYEMRDELYRPVLEDVVSLGDITWSKPCPSVAFDESTLVKNAENPTVSPEGSPLVVVNAINPNDNVLWPPSPWNATMLHTNPSIHEGLKYVRLQYRPLSGGEWISAKSTTSTETDRKHNLLCDNSRLDGCKFEWDVNNKFEKLLSGFKDDAYEVRIKNFCVGGNALAEPRVHEFVSDQRLTLRVDTVAPIPASTLAFPGASSGVNFYEEIRCEDATFDLFRREALNCDGTVAHVHDELIGTKVSEEDKTKFFRMNCFNTGGRGSIVVSSKDSSKVFGVYEVKVSLIKDVALNTGRDVTFELRATCLAPAPSSATAQLGVATLRGAASHATTIVNSIERPIHSLLQALLVFIAVVIFGVVIKSRGSNSPATSPVKMTSNSYGATV